MILFDSVASYIEMRLIPDKKLIWYDSIGKLFYISSSDTGIASIIDILDPIQLFAKYGNWIKASPYYIEYMAYILGNHAI